jgi:HEPN domain-containing protein
VSDVEDYARELLVRANDDLAAAQALLDVPAVSDAIVGFHAQQAVEKALKAILVIRAAPTIPRTHNLALLTQLCEDTHLEIPESLNDVDLLSPYAVALRYDSQPPASVTRSQAITFADAAIQWAFRLIGS